MRSSDSRIRLSSAKESSEIDRLTQLESDQTGLVLMNQAGKATFEFIESKVLPFVPIESILIVVGSGNNGGDALVVARELAQKGLSNITLWTFSDEVSELQQKQWDAIDRFDFNIERFSGSEKQREQIQNSSLIVDGLFGVGLDRPVEGDYKLAIDWLNESLEPVLSLDIPSGLSADTGRVFGSGVEAQWTTSYGLAKPGMYIWDGPRLTGELHVFDIGFSESIVEKVANSHFLVDIDLAHKLIPIREETSNKSNHGHVNVIAGREGMWGAAVLCSQGAFRVGAGYVKLCHQDDATMLTSELPDVLSQVFKNASELENEKTYVVGPGYGVGPRCESVIRHLLDANIKHVVLDADALTTLSTLQVGKLPSTWVLTPHAGEMGRLLGVASEEIDADRISAAKVAVEKYGATVLLKGYKTIVCDSSQVEIINSGNSALATAGTGDVLAGMIGGFLAQGMSTRDATSLASFLHGTVADLWVKKGRAKNSLMASDVLEGLPESYQWIQNYHTD